MTTTVVQPAEVHRPLGVTILAILQLIAGLLGLCLPTIFLIGGTLVALLGPVGTMVGVLGILAGLVMLIGPLLHLIVAIGALSLRRWAWWLGLIATGVDVLGAALNIWNGAGLIAAILPVGFSLLVFVYLLTPGVRQAFRI
jgi:hypothetical protein